VCVKRLTGDCGKRDLDGLSRQRLASAATLRVALTGHVYSEMLEQINQVSDDAKAGCESGCADC